MRQDSAEISVDFRRHPIVEICPSLSERPHDMRNDMAKRLVGRLVEINILPTTNLFQPLSRVARDRASTEEVRPDQIDCCCEERQPSRTSKNFSQISGWKKNGPGIHENDDKPCHRFKNHPCHGNTTTCSYRIQDPPSFRYPYNSPIICFGSLTLQRHYSISASRTFRPCSSFRLATFLQVFSSPP